MSPAPPESAGAPARIETPETVVGYIAAPEIWYFEGVEGEVLTVIAPELLEQRERGAREPSEQRHTHPAAD